MEHKAPYAIAGLFVCLCVAALVFFVIWVRGGNDEAYARYTVLFPDNVSGLEEGAQVLYRGVPVGKVETMRLPQKHADDIRVDIRIRRSVPVHETSHAELALAGITGVVNVNVVAPKEGDTAPPQRLAGEPYPVIQGQPSALEKAMKDVPAITRDLRAFTGDLNKKMDNFEGSFLGGLMGAGEGELDKSKKP